MAMVKSSAGGVEDPAHLGALANKFVVFCDSLLCLQDSDLHPFLPHKVKRGGGNLGEGEGLGKAAILKLFHMKDPQIEAH